MKVENVQIMTSSELRTQLQTMDDHVILTETTFAAAYRNGLTIEELSLLQSMKQDSHEAVLADLQEQLLYVDQELKEICSSLYRKLKAMSAEDFSKIEFSEEDAYE